VPVTPHPSRRRARGVQALAKSFETADLPSRCAKFVPRKQWVAIGSDDMFIRVFNYNTMEREKAFEAHADYIRSLAVHPSLPYLLSCSDDMLIKLWDWDKGWACTQIFEGHVHYVMQARARSGYALSTVLLSCAWRPSASACSAAILCDAFHHVRASAPAARNVHREEGSTEQATARGGLVMGTFSSVKRSVQQVH
jgi:WD domain, G-beta repeat